MLTLYCDFRIILWIFLSSSVIRMIDTVRGRACARQVSFNIQSVTGVSRSLGWLSGWSGRSGAAWAAGCGWRHTWRSWCPRRSGPSASSCSGLCTVHARVPPEPRWRAWCPEWSRTTSPWRRPSACADAPRPVGKRPTAQSGPRRRRKPGARVGGAGTAWFSLRQKEKKNSSPPEDEASTI